MAIVVLNLLLAIFAIVIALRYGDRDLQHGAAITALMLALNLVGRSALSGRFQSVDLVSLTVDIIGLMGFSYIGIRSTRIWPIWAASLQLISVGAHFVRALDLPVKPIVYAWMKSGPTWAVMIILISATLINWHRNHATDKKTS